MKKIIIISLWGLVAIAVIVMIVFAENLYRNRKCTELKIDIDYGKSESFTEAFITYEDIQEFVDKRFKSIKGNKVSDINIEKIENEIGKMSYVKRVDCSVDLDGDVYLRIKQRRPILRIINTKGDNYYIDEDGTLLPGRIGYSARVVTANGNINDSLIDIYKTNVSSNDSLLHKTVLGKLYKLACVIDKDSFLRQDITQIYVNGINDYELVPLVGEHTILFGDATQIADKFWKLKQFYTRGIRLGGWDKYKTVNLKYKDQIVCTKKIFNYGIQ